MQSPIHYLIPDKLCWKTPRGLYFPPQITNVSPWQHPDILPVLCIVPETAKPTRAKIWWLIWITHESKYTPLYWILLCFGKWCHIYKYFRISYRNDDLSSKWHFARYVAEDHDQEPSITHVLHMHIWAKATYNCFLVVWNQLVVLPIPVVLTSLAVGQSHDFPNARDTTIKMFRYS